MIRKWGKDTDYVNIPVCDNVYCILLVDIEVIQLYKHDEKSLYPLLGSCYPWGEKEGAEMGPGVGFSWPCHCFPKILLEVITWKVTKH